MDEAYALLKQIVEQGWWRHYKIVNSEWVIPADLQVKITAYIKEREMEKIL